MLDLEWDSGQRALRENGLEDEFVKRSRSGGIEEKRLCGKDGVPIFHRKVAKRTTVDLKESRPEIDRRVLRELLLEAVPADSIKWGHALASVRPLEGGQHELTFSNGVVAVADIVVGADGAHSRVRPLVSPATPQYYGVTGAEISIAPDVAARPENRDILDAIGLGALFACEDGKMFGTGQPNVEGRIRAYAWHRTPLGWALPSSPKEAKKALLEVYDGWAPWLRKFIEVCDEDAIYSRPLFYLPVGHRWPHKAGVTLVGDAAHLMGPFAGAGANLAMLDGLELGLLLADAISKDLTVEEREAAIAAWEEEMLTRAEGFAAMTAQNLEACLSPDAPQSIAAKWRKAFGQVKDEQA